MSLIYKYEDKGFGDGTYFYVYDVNLESLSSIEFTDINDEKKEAIDKVCASLFKELDTDYLFDWEHKYVFNYSTKNDGFDYIYLIYDIDLSRLTILEVQI